MNDQIFKSLAQETVIELLNKRDIIYINDEDTAGPYYEYERKNPKINDTLTLNINPLIDSKDIQNVKEIKKKQDIIGKRKYSEIKVKEGEVYETDHYHPNKKNNCNILLDNVSSNHLYNIKTQQWCQEDQEHDELLTNMAIHQRKCIQKINQNDNKLKNKNRIGKWDEMLDVGKIKKVKNKKPFVSNEGKSNAFANALNNKKKLNSSNKTKFNSNNKKNVIHKSTKIRKRN